MVIAPTGTGRVLRRMIPVSAEGGRLTAEDGVDEPGVTGLGRVCIPCVRCSVGD